MEESDAIGIQMLVTFTDCSSGGVLINGNPNIDVTGHFSFLSGNPSGTWFLRMSGGVYLNGQSEFINLIFYLPSPGAARACVTGYIGAFTVNNC